MFKTIGFVIVAAIAAVLVYAATRPDELRVQRAIAIKAPPEKIFPLVNDLKAWAAWSPYEKKDPAMARTFSAATAGKGASYEWNGNKEVGHGRMEIVDSAASSRVAFDLHFITPFESRSVAEFSFEPKGDATQVTWLMHGPNAYVSKLMGVFFDMDKMIGTDFEAGLANLKAQAEK